MFNNCSVNTFMVSTWWISKSFSILRLISGYCTRRFHIQSPFMVANILKAAHRDVGVLRAALGELLALLLGLLHGGQLPELLLDAVQLNEGQSENVPKNSTINQRTSLALRASCSGQLPAARFWSGRPASRLDQRQKPQIRWKTFLPPPPPGAFSLSSDCKRGWKL